MPLSDSPLPAAGPLPAVPAMPTDKLRTEPRAGRVRAWEKMGPRVAADVASAGLATMLISPVICLIDRSIMENASGRSKSVLSSVSASLKTIFTRPHHFFLGKPFGLIFMTYFGTYITANLLDTFSAARADAPIATVTSGPQKFVATSTANMSLGLLKDRQFARMFGTGAPRPVPLPILALFSTRDAMTIAFSFNLPPVLAPLLPENPLMGRLSTAQFLAPAACQLISTPLHLLGLDMYNRGKGVAWRSRLSAVRKDYVQSAAARMCRIIPAFGFGGVANAGLRRGLMERIEGGAGKHVA